MNIHTRPVTVHWGLITSRTCREESDTPHWERSAAPHWCRSWRRSDTDLEPVYPPSKFTHMAHVMVLGFRQPRPWGS